MRTKQRMALALLAASLTVLGACGSSNSPGGGGNEPTPTPTPNPPGMNQIVFTPVGSDVAGDLVDLEFLPGQGGEAIAIGLGGTVYYLKNDFTPLAQTFEIAVDNDSEQGLLNVVADPDYASNGFIYLYYTVQGSDPDVNRLTRYQVQVDVGAGSFTLTSPLDIISFDKAQAPGPANNHNGGSLLFGVNRELFIGVGDGGGSSSSDTNVELSQRYDISLGKIHRIIPDPDGLNNYTIPDCQGIPNTGNPGVACDDTPTTIYSIGLRNPFTIVKDEDADLFVGDVGADKFEEINCVYFANENYGWPHCEGPCSVPTPPFNDPIHGYAHGDETFNDEDPEDNQVGGPQSIFVSAFYLGSGYGGRFTGKLIYNDFYDGWVRLLSLDAADRVVADEHIGHQNGLTGLHESPVDGLLYGVSLGGSDKVLRLDLLN